MASALTDTTRERIVEAAGEMFAERGFEVTTVRDICQAAGANVAAVNYYFGDKQRLYVEAVVRAHQWRMKRAALPEWSPTTTAEVKLRDFIVTFLRRIRTGPEDTWHSRLMMREMIHPTEACAEMAQATIRPQFEVLQQIVRELSAGDPTPTDLHLTAFSIVGQCLFYHFADPVVRSLVSQREYNEYDVDRLADHIVAFSLAAIGNLPANAKPQPARRRAAR